MTTQLENIKKKANFLFAKLYPYLINVSADGRRDTWKTIMVSLFSPVLLMCKFEKSKTEVEKVNTLMLMTSNGHLMIPKNASPDGI